VTHEPPPTAEELPSPFLAPLMIGEMRADDGGVIREHSSASDRMAHYTEPEKAQSR
jgi:hypothetical protein